MTKTVLGSSLIFALLFSATIGAVLVNLATANPYEIQRLLEEAR